VKLDLHSTRGFALTPQQMFDSLMRHKFKGLPGDMSVKVGHYHVVDERRRWAAVGKEQWDKSVFPGSKLSMSIVLAELRTTLGACPRNQSHRVLASGTSVDGPYNWFVPNTP
jgi:hypothetical protein